MYNPQVEISVQEKVEDICYLNLLLLIRLKIVKLNIKILFIHF